jgi:hypothetical protein
MANVPRVPSAIEGSPADFRTMFAHAPEVMRSFYRLYGEIWASAGAAAELKELLRVRTARVVDCFL